MGNYSIMRFDLHIHSNYSSDSNLTVDDILKQAVKAGLDGIAICDHNTVAGSLFAIKRAQEMNMSLLVIAGIEVSTTGGHIIVLGVRDNIKPDLTPEDTIRTAKEKGGITIAAHPFKIRSIGNVDGLDIDAVETFNSRCLFGENAQAKVMAKSIGKSEVGGSDSHLLATIGFGFTEIKAEKNEAAVLQAIREGKSSSGGRVVPLYVVIIQVMRGIVRRMRSK
jgi:predicted metal-dependent phosphoesterase TrpH